MLTASPCTLQRNTAPKIKHFEIITIHYTKISCKEGTSNKYCQDTQDFKPARIAVGKLLMQAL